MISRIRRFLAPNPLYRQLFPSTPLKLKIRGFSANEDTDSLLRIHDLNAPNRFPENHRPIFEKALHEQHESFFVAELDDGTVAGCGGVLTIKENVNVLYYGIIHPDFQGFRIGSSLTLARLSFATRTSGQQFSVIYAVSKSVPFYARFGFSEAQKWIGDDGNQYPLGVLSYDSSWFRAIDKVLAKRGLLLDKSKPIERDEHRVAVIKELDHQTCTLEIKEINPNQSSHTTPASAPR